MKTLLRTTAVAVTATLILAACNSESQGDASTSSAPDQTNTTEATGTTDVTSTTADTSTTVANSAGEASITIENFAFSGATSVSAGTTVTVTNQDGVTHTWTSEDDVWNSGGLSSGDSFEYTFDEPGEYSYFCSIHPTMEGTITVEG